MPYYERLNCIFVHIPKTAGTSIGSRLRAANGGTAHLEGRSTKADRALMGVQKDNMQHLAWADIPSFVEETTLRRCFSFTIVRNPWDYVRSLYAYEGLPARFERVASMPPATYRRALLASSLSFSDWLRLRVAGEGDFALHQQIRYVEGGFRDLDLVWTGKPGVLWEQLCAVLGLDHSPLPRLNSSDSARVSLTESDNELIANHFQDDINAFGFDVPF